MASGSNFQCIISCTGEAGKDVKHLASALVVQLRETVTVKEPSVSFRSSEMKVNVHHTVFQTSQRLRWMAGEQTTKSF